MPRARHSVALATAALAAALFCAPAAQAAPVATATGVTATGVTAAVPSVPAGLGTRPRVSTAYELPGDRVYPEGIAVDPRTGDLYAGSFADGTVFKMTPGRRTAQIFLPAGADGRHTANGLKVDRFGRLWVTDSTTGVSVYDTRSRRLLARFEVPGKDARFVNDLAVTPDGGAYLTDSVRALVYQVTPDQLAGAGGESVELTPRFDLGGVLDAHAPDAFTLNGIVADPSGRHLLTVDMTGGDLYRLDLVSGAIRRVALHGGDMIHADGLELQNGRLWVVHNTTNTISRWRIAGDSSSARVERRVTDEALQIPTTLVRARGTLYVVRSQFDKGGPLGEGTPQTPFTVAAVRGV
ncbi:SMP-30/gluconolactonase/LRE family protein [Planomonospora sp. ID67723]|uniref:SMP-30/gluconolactonase/LRE family protein n=1 Tax=Planomonospora sp. ID67723 TaxID=2738134 RepID=UPI0018C3D2E1|nr:SMP-30/gluconolactonase/LRE family protein [Planomonospora sp. ID67723]MBG0826327.1 SMP-30/gluconolactonase/LRE family protein [Planomonospora sp. ID67723]